VSLDQVVAGAAGILDFDSRGAVCDPPGATALRATTVARGTPGTSANGSDIVAPQLRDAAASNQDGRAIVDDLEQIEMAGHNE